RMRFNIAGNAQMRFGISRAALLKQPGQNFPRISSSEQGPRVPPRCAFQQNVYGGIQPQTDGFAVNKSPEVILNEHPAASGDDCGLSFQQFSERVSLQNTEISLAMNGKDVTHRQSCGGANGFICIN